MFGVGLGQIANVLSRFESRSLQVDPVQCTRIRHKNSTCARCVDGCPTHAITITRALEIDTTKCTDCGICASLCPTGALESSSPTNAELLKSIQDRKQSASLVFACQKAVSGPDPRVVPVNCLGRLDESILVGAVSDGIEQILLVDGPCQDCPNAPGRTLAGRVVTESNAVAQAFGISPRISFVAQLPSLPTAAAASTPPPDALSRRAFFNMLTRETKAAAALTVSTVLEKEPEKKPEIKRGELPQRLPARRRLLLESLKRMGKPEQVAFESPNGSWAVAHIKENCIGSQMCAFFCPTGALTKTEREGKAGLAIRVSYCVNCGLCQQICFWQALELSSQIRLDQVVEDVSSTFIFSTDASALQSTDAKLKRLVQSIH